eukprot:m.52492 g.52492  ORF g.52492 m.52492 type:complete len:744 (+) comp10796_c0_seq1:308-2539(+)
MIRRKSVRKANAEFDHDPTQPHLSLEIIKVGNLIGLQVADAVSPESYPVINRIGSGTPAHEHPDVEVGDKVKAINGVWCKGKTKNFVHNQVRDASTTVRFQIIKAFVDVDKRESLDGGDVHRTNPLLSVAAHNPELISGKRDKPLEPTHSKNSFKSEFQIDVSDKGLLGKGRFSKVFKCVELATKHEYAVKVVDLKSLSEEERLKTDMEGSICKLLQHECICNLYKLFREPNYHYLVFELMDGEELFNHMVGLGGGGAPEDECREWMYRVLLALRECHSKDVVHRDVKLENLMLDAFGNCKLIDFGLAVYLDRGPQEFGMAGSPAYIAPEILDYKEYGKPVDMWSAGVCAYMMLSGTMPFNGDDTEEMYAEIRECQLEFPGFEWANVSEAAQSFISALLVRNPDNRLTVNGALQHAWIVNGSRSRLSIAEAPKKFQQKEGGFKRRNSYNFGEPERLGGSPKWNAFNLDQESCDASVLASGHGTFLIRELEDSTDHQICAYDAGNVVHVNLEMLSNGKHKYGADIFNSLEEVVAHFQETPLMQGRGGNIYLEHPALDFLVEGKSEARCKSDVRLCGPGAFLVLKVSDTKFKLFLFDAMSVKTVPFTYNPAKDNYQIRGTTFGSLDQLLVHLGDYPIQGKGGRDLEPERPALPARMVPAAIVSPARRGSVRGSMAVPRGSMVYSPAGATTPSFSPGAPQVDRAELAQAVRSVVQALLPELRKISSNESNEGIDQLISSALSKAGL